jgi:hypothetical protein
MTRYIFLPCLSKSHIVYVLRFKHAITLFSCGQIFHGYSNLIVKVFPTWAQFSRQVKLTRFRFGNFLFNKSGTFG